MKRLIVVLTLLLGACGQKHDSAWLGYGKGDYAFVSAPQAGWLTSLAVERGQLVHRGGLLFTLDSTEQRASRDQAEAALVQTKASLAQEEANLAYMQTELARQNRLMRANAGTQQAYDQAENNARQSSARIAQMKAQIGQMEASLSGATYNLSQRRVAFVGRFLVLTERQSRPPDLDAVLGSGHDPRERWLPMLWPPVPARLPAPGARSRDPAGVRA